MKVNILRATVTLTPTMDLVVLELEAPSSVPSIKGNATALVHCMSDYGVQWVRLVTGREPDEIVNTRWTQ